MYQRLGFLGAIVAVVALAAAFAIARNCYVSAKVFAATPVRIDKFQAENELHIKQASQETVVIIGDSRVAQWRPMPELPQYRFLNRGVGGETSAQLRFRFNQDAIGLAPTAIVLQTGINDLVAASLEPEIAGKLRRNLITNIRSFVDQANAAGIPVVLMKIIPPGDVAMLRRPFWSDDIYSLVHEVNSLLDWFDGRNGVVVVDPARQLLDSNGAWKSGFSEDTLHLTPLAYQALNPQIAEALLAVGNVQGMR